MARSSFRGPSADAAAVLVSELDDALRGAGDQTAQRVAGELFAVAATLRSEGSLRRFATDASLPDDARTGLVEQLFGAKVDAVTLGVLRSAVSRRWTATRDLADALEHLGVVATVRGAEGSTERLADELFEVARTITDNPALRDALADPVRTLDDKRALVRDLLGGRALPSTVGLAEQSLAGSYRTVGAALADYQQVVADVQGQNVATVRVATPLPESELQRLTDVLSRQYGRQVHLNVLVDPTVIGGVRVEIADDVIDGTVSSRLDDARRQLAG